MALDLEDLQQLRAADSEVAAPESAPAEVAAEAPAVEMTDVGVIPAPEPEVAADVAAAPTASQQAYDPAPADPQLADQLADSAQADGKTTSVAGDSHDLDRGLFDWRDYQAACIAAGTPEKWRDEFRHGVTGASEFLNPGETGNPMTWQLTSSTSASAAISAWLAGPTIADTATVATARQIDAIRAKTGDALFDRLFGSADGALDSTIPGGQRLVINGRDPSRVATMHRLADQALDTESGAGDELGIADLGDTEPQYSDQKYTDVAPVSSVQSEDVLISGPVADTTVATASYATDNTGYGDAEPTYADSYAPPGFLAATSEQIDMPFVSEEQQLARDQA